MSTRFYIPFITLLAVSFSVQAFQADTLTVKILGTAEDARFEPAVVQIQPGDVIRFEVEEGLHTVTAYHPDNRRPMRMPEEAEAFDSGPLTAGQSWMLKIEKEGVYDYFCLPHERIGHAGRILSGEVEEIPAYPAGRIPELVLKTLKSETRQYFNSN